MSNYLKKSDFHACMRVVLLRCMKHDIKELPLRASIFCDCHHKGRTFFIKCILTDEGLWPVVTSSGAAFNYKQLGILP